MKRRSSILGDDIVSPKPLWVRPPYTPPTPDDKPLVVPTITPVVYVKEVHVWEYKIVVRESEPRDMVDEAELNALGADGWEMSGIVIKPESSIYYFKRLKS